MAFICILICGNRIQIFSMARPRRLQCTCARHSCVPMGMHTTASNAGKTTKQEPPKIWLFLPKVTCIMTLFAIVTLALRVSRPKRFDHTCTTDGSSTKAKNPAMNETTIWIVSFHMVLKDQTEKVTVSALLMDTLWPRCASLAGAPTTLVHQSQKDHS